LYYEDAYINGKQVWDYNLNLATGGYFTVGTLCHEFNHSLGAPDLYHYYSDGPTACGGWDVMASSLVFVL
jgi:M6 family metalloprotease-like protein